MIITGNWRDRDFSLSVKQNSLTVSFARDSGADVFSWEGAGRLWTCLEDGISYRRGLDGRVVAKWQKANTVNSQNLLRSVWKRLRQQLDDHFNETSSLRMRRWLEKAEGLALESRARARLSDLVEALKSEQAAVQSPVPADTWSFVETILAFDQQRSIADTQQYASVYKPVGILPPDQYFSVVLQATEGCSFNTCTYCTFYRDRPFRIKSSDQFAAHTRQVKAFIGAGMSLRRTIFLGDANALVVPMKRLVEIFEITNLEFEVNALGGIFAFLDGFSGEHKSEDDFRVLASLGLKRIYLGLESGNAELLRFLKKPGHPNDVLQAVTSMKNAGIAVGIIVLLGAGGHAYASSHIEDTVKLLNEMPLDADDLIYFSELIENEGMDYTTQAHAANLRPLSSAERIAQGSLIEEQLCFSEEGGTPHISRYDIREFVY